MSKVIVIGDVMLDQYTYGDVIRISPEAPIPVLKQTSNEFKLGGAANVAANLRALNVEVYLFSASGTDAAAYGIDTLLEKVYIDNYIVKAVELTTPHKHRFVSNNHQILRVDTEEKFFINNYTQSRLYNLLSQKIKDCEVLIISDYNKGLITENFALSLMELARANNIKVLVDTKKTDIKCFSGAYLITPNEAEGSKIASTSALDEIAGFCSEYVENILITRGDKGMYLWDGFNTYNVKALANKLVDVSGAGDTVLAVMAQGVLNKIPLHKTMRVANLAASIVVSKFGTSVCTKEELNHAIQRGELKHYNETELVSLIKEWKKDGLVIGFINGSFNLLHKGHLHLIKTAKQQCNKLIVAINSDDYLLTYKNIQAFPNRAVNVAVIPYVDAVIVFTESTPKNLISILKPNIHFTGDDYSISDIKKVSNVKIVQIPRITVDISSTQIYSI